MNQYILIQNQGSFVCRYPIESEGERASMRLKFRTGISVSTRLSLMPPFTCAPIQSCGSRVRGVRVWADDCIGACVCYCMGRNEGDSCIRMDLSQLPRGE